MSILPYMFNMIFDDIQQKALSALFQKKNNRDFFIGLGEFFSDYISLHHKDYPILASAFSKESMLVLHKLVQESNPLDIKETIKNHLTDRLSGCDYEGYDIYITRFTECCLRYKAAQSPSEYSGIIVTDIHEDLAKTDAESKRGLRSIEGHLYTIERKIDNIAEPRMPVNDCCDLLRIDSDFISQCSIPEDERERFIVAYHIFTHRLQSTLKMLYNHLLIESDESLSLSRKILDIVESSTVTFFAADSGSGKSTLICQSALLAAQTNPDEDVYFLSSYETSFLPSLSRRSIIIVDDAFRNISGVLALHCKYQHNPSVHYLFVDQTQNINHLILSIQDDISDWLIDAQGIILTRSTTSIKLPLIKQSRIQLLEMSDEFVEKVSAELIKHRIQHEELCADLPISIDYNHKTITDVEFEYFSEYNRIATGNEAYLKMHTWDWDLWNNIPGLSGSFHLVAALQSCGIPVSTICLDRITNGHSNDLINAINAGEACFEIVGNRYIGFRHDSVVNYAFAYNSYSRYDSFMKLIENDYLDEDTVVAFEKKLFSLIWIRKPPFDLGNNKRMSRLLKRFRQSERYVGILESHGRIHSLEFACLLDTALHNKQNISQSIGDSFSYVSNLPSYRGKEVFTWIKYFNFAFQAEASLPCQMLEALTIQPTNSLYKKITQLIDTSFLKWHDTGYSESQTRMFYSNSEDLFKWIIEKVNPDDIPSRYALCRIYRRQQRYDDTTKILQTLYPLLITDDDYFKYTMNLISNYTQKAKHLAQKAFSPENKRLIAQTNLEIEEEYTRALYKYADDENNFDKYITLIDNYTQYLLDRGKFSEAYELLTMTVEKCESTGNTSQCMRLFRNLGFVCQRYRPWNAYYDLSKADYWFTLALETTTEKKERLGILKPLCLTNLTLEGDKEKALSICSEMRQLDAKDSSIVILAIEATRLKTISSACLLSVSDENGPLLPSQIDEEELNASILSIQEAMTDIQKHFAFIYCPEAFGHSENLVSQKKPKDIYTILRSILYDKEIPPELLRKIKLSWDVQNKLWKEFMPSANPSEQIDTVTETQIQ